MSEKRFIVDRTELEIGTPGVITEGELKRRFYLAAGLSDDAGWDYVRDILLHGEEEE